MSLSATSAINSLFVGFSEPKYIRVPKIVLIASIRPLFHATSIACLIARYTLLGEVLNLFAIDGYNSLVT